jgi:DNA-binding beta-propeller fold protein YncE
MASKLSMGSGSYAGEGVGMKKRFDPMGVGVGVAGALLALAPAFSGCGPANPSGESVRAAPSPTRADERKIASSCERSQPGVGPRREGDTRQGSSVALAREGDRLFAYVADKDRAQITVVDLSSDRVVQTVPTSGGPEQVLVLEDGRVVASIADGAHLEVFEPTGSSSEVLASRCARTVPAGPFGLALSTDDATLVVTSAWEPSLSSFAAKDLSLRGAQTLPRSPRGVLVDDTGRAFVSHVAGANLSVVDLAKLERFPRSIDLRVRTSSPEVAPADAQILRGGVQGYALVGVELTPAGAGGALRDEYGTREAPPPLAGKVPVQPRAKPKPKPKPGLAPVSPDPSKPMLEIAPPGELPAPVAPKARSMRVIVPMVSVDPGDKNRPTQHYYGPPPTGGVPKEAPVAVVVDAVAEKSLTSVVTPAPSGAQAECVLPRSAAYSRATGQLLVTCMGIDELFVLDASATDPMRAVRDRHALPAGPTGVAVAERERVAVTFGQFDAALAVVSLDGKGTRTIPIDTKASSLTPTHAEGRRLFYRARDTRLTFDGIACASCHPDGGDDGVSWSTPEGMRQTLMLAGRVQGTAPYGWSRKQGTLSTYISDTSSRLGGSGMPESDVHALASFVKHIPGPPKRSESALAAEGREAFFSAGCDSCHVAAVGTDAQSYKFSLDDPSSSYEEGFDTPSLLNVNATGPYFHDGRYETLEALLADPNSKMGSTASLSSADRASIRAFLESL